MNIWLLVPLLGALVQGSILSFLTVRGVQLDLVLVLVVVWGLVRGARDGLAWAMVGGLVLDLLSLAPMGSYTLSLLVVAFLVGLIEGTSFGLTRALVGVVTLLAVPLYLLLSALMIRLIGWPVDVARLLAMLPLSLLFDVALALFLLPFARRLSWLAGERAVEWTSR